MYVERDEALKIIKTFSRKQYEGQEFVEGAEVDKTTEQIDSEKKMIGVMFENVMCSATRDDMTGLKAIEDWIVEGNDVPFKFKNGNTLVLSVSNIAAFKAVWIPFRASFFK